MRLLQKILNPQNYIGVYRPIKMITILSFFSVLIWIGIVHKTGRTNYYYLLWNLFLAWVPMFFAYLMYHRIYNHTERLNAWKFWGLSLFWLLFFPNAPYLITDLIHINERHAPSTWGDPLLFFSFALTGVMTGIVSLFIMRLNFQMYYSNKIGWIWTHLSILLCGFGIFLGRIQRWNSWDIVTRPDILIKDMVQQLDNPMAIYFTLGFSSLMGMLFLAMAPFFQLQKTPN